jgi:hypothetical protein
VTSEAEDNVTRPLNKAPAADLTIPVPREEMVVDPETANVPVMEVVARVETPEMVKAVADALPNVDWPVTVSWAIVVVARVEVALTVRPEAVVKVKLEEVAMALVPLPNNISPAVRLAAPVPPLATESCPCQPKVRALLAILPVTLVPLMTNTTNVEPRVELLVPPLAIGRIPEMSEVNEAKPL